MIVVDRVPIINESKYNTLVARIVIVIVKVFTRKGPINPKDVFVGMTPSIKAKLMCGAIRCQVLVHWHGEKAQCEVAQANPKWTELFVSWSPLGTKFPTVHHQGVRLWGTSSFESQEKFAHAIVTLVAFSPCEKYLVTWSCDPINVPGGASQGPRYFPPGDGGNHIEIWKIVSRNLLRTFPVLKTDGEDSDIKTQMHWPWMKWSLDDKYVARVTPGQQISVYELPSMGLEGKKSVKIEGVVDFERRPLEVGRAEEQGKTLGLEA